MLEVVWFSSSSGNTDKFIQNVMKSIPTELLTNDVCFVKINKNKQITHKSINPAILICPCYADGNGKKSVPSQVIQYLNNETTRKNLLGVIGSGNKNFGKFFAYSADIIASKCNIPVLYKFELAGMETDIKTISKLIEELTT